VPYSYVTKCTDLARELQKRPISVALNANNWGSYASGVFNNKCSQTSVNHAVVVVGWNKSKGNWLIKNSWGTNWGVRGVSGGSRGYMWLSKNNCRGVCDYLYYASK